MSFLLLAAEKKNTQNGAPEMSLRMFVRSSTFKCMQLKVAEANKFIQKAPINNITC